MIKNLADGMIQISKDKIVKVNIQCFIKLTHVPTKCAFYKVSVCGTPKEPTSSPLH